MEAGESVTAETIAQGQQVKITDKEDTLYAAVIHQPVELPPEEEETAQEEATEAESE